MRRASELKDGLDVDQDEIIRPAKRQSIFILLLTIGFSLFLLGVVVLANRGEIGPYSRHLTSLPYGDKIGHFLLMGTLSCLVNLSLSAKRFRFAGWRFLLGSVIVTAIITAEELSQAFIPNRTLSLGDWVADIVGIILFGQLALYLVTRKTAR